MPITDLHPLHEETVWAYMADVSTASSTFAAFPFRGRIVKMGSILHVAITGANSEITSKIAATAITGGAWTITQSGSAAGDVDTATPTGAHRGNEDDNIEFISDGASSTTAPMTFWARIRAE